MKGDWRHWYTCLKDFSECPLCDAGLKSSYVAAYTIIDHSKYTNKKGEEVKNIKKLLLLKSSVQSVWARRRQESGGDLTYCVYKVYRDTKENTSTGEDIQFQKKLTKAQVLRFKPKDVSPEEWIKPFDYLEIFKPKTVDELRKIVRQKPVGSDDYDGDSSLAGVNSQSIPKDAEVVDGDADIDSLL